MNTCRGLLAVLGRRPVRGEGKTRLARELGADRAHEIACELLENVIEVVSSKELTRELDVAWWMTGSGLGGSGGWDADAEEMHRPVLPAGARVFEQPSGDLGERMSHAFESAWSQGRPFCLLMGTDIPLLGVPQILEGVRLLRSGADAVMLPTEDGGYGMIGLRSPAPEIFQNMPWSTTEVAKRTTERLEQMGRSVCSLPMLWDVDRAEDWDKWNLWKHG